MFKIIDSTFTKSELKQVVNKATQLNDEEITQLLSLVRYFKDLFDGNFGDWYTEPIYLEIKLGSEPFNSKYYPVHRINT